MTEELIWDGLGDGPKAGLGCPTLPILVLAHGASLQSPCCGNRSLFNVLGFFICLGVGLFVCFLIFLKNLHLNASVCSIHLKG